MLHFVSGLVVILNTATVLFIRTIITSIASQRYPDVVYHCLRRFPTMNPTLCLKNYPTAKRAYLGRSSEGQE